MNIIYVLLALLALLFIEGLIYRNYWPRGVKADARFSQSKAVEGQTVELCETIEYTGRLPLPWVRMKFQVSRDVTLPDSPHGSVSDYYNREEVFSVGSMEKVVRRLPVCCEKRGEHRVFGVDVVSSDLFLTQKLIVSFEGSSGVTVYPRTTEIPEILDRARQIIGERIVQRAQNDDPFMFRGIREYMPGDQLSRINWRATARSDKLLVNQFDYTSDLSVSVWLCIDERSSMRDESLTEECIRIAATLISELADDGIPVSLYSNGCDTLGNAGIMIGGGCSQEHKENCLTALARLNIEVEPSPIIEYMNAVPRSAGENELIIFISSQASERLCGHVKQFAVNRELFWIAPIREEDDQEFQALKTIKNSCVWRVVCER